MGNSDTFEKEIVFKTIIRSPGIYTIFCVSHKDLRYSGETLRLLFIFKKAELPFSQKFIGFGGME